MIPLAKGAVGLLALGAAAGAGFGASYLHSEAQPQKPDRSGDSQPTVPEEKEVILPNNWRWLNTENDTDKGEWTKKVKEYKGEDGKKLEGYAPETGEGKEDANVGKMKLACKGLKEGRHKNADLEGKLSQAKDWCSIKRKVKEMLGKDKVELSFDENNNTQDNTEWEAMFQKRLKDTAKIFAKEKFKSTESSTSEKENDIKAMKAECKALKDKDVEDGEANLALFKDWCTKPKVS